MTTTSPGLQATPGAEPPGTAPESHSNFSGRQRGRRRFWVSAEGDPAWARPALLVLLIGTACLYLINLSNSGYANEYYAAAAQAGSESWKALFFGSLDASNYITVDKPPASLWLMGLSGQIFGFSSFSMLLPQAIEGILSVAFLYAAVKRWSGPAAGLLAGAILALTPAAVLIFRFNNPDALLVLLLTIATYCMVRAMEKGATKWVLLCGTAIGFAFLAKMLQGFVIVPALGLAYLVCAPVSFKRRFLQLLGGFAMMIVSCGWYIAIVYAWPADSRPYIGGSEGNSILNLVFGYNGLGRVFGGDGNAGGGGGGGMSGGQAGSSFGGPTGLNRLFSSDMGDHISWLLPAALIALVAGLILTARRPRTDRTRAALIMWGGWLLITGLLFSFMEGTIHPYYTVALAPAIAALIGISGKALWDARESWFARIGLALIVLAAGLWSFTLLARNDDWHPEIRYILLPLTVIAALVLLVPIRLAARTIAAAMVVGVLAGGTGTVAYALPTAATGHSGSIPSVGPSGSGSGMSMGGGGGMGGGSSSSDSSEIDALLQSAGTTWAAAANSANSSATYQLSSGEPIMALGGFSGSDDAITLAEFKELVADGQVRYYISGGMGGGGGMGRSSSSSSSTDSGTDSSQSQSQSSQGTTELPEGMELPGGSSGSSDDSSSSQGGPGGNGGGNGGGMGGGTTSEIAEWVAENFTATTVGSTTVYDLQSSTTTSAS
ncbi:glycosyltransferase family 39 protein [Kineosporia sp. J2-2]|uniref:Glycosyltransferase family 39 protein n=1 Tax=Kineosporia corallincola TaxID=2835133 RepID=A0ABS5TF42_9ACTN|nr:glycosyltransferase family 39 protein [Kineosporia corallincola]MBT0769686.1 glycosyltransferase family 39 protein [Kineosporia corallincola]